MINELCPSAYSYAYEDETSTYNCINDELGNGANYDVTFCPIEDTCYSVSSNMAGYK